jgi:pimeloyl-ACP methyl ester carboxylesterase
MQCKYVCVLLTRQLLSTSTGGGKGSGVTLRSESGFQVLGVALSFHHFVHTTTDNVTTPAYRRARPSAQTSPSPRITATKMRKTLLLVFIHGFKGSDNTFNDFPKDIRALLSTALPHIDVLTIQYPRYETRGDLRECVTRFKEWLENKVIDLEVASRTPSPTVDPSVRVVLVGHSMGGIVAAETLLSIARDEPVRPGAGNDPNDAASRPQSPRSKDGLNPPDHEERATSAPPEGHSSALFFPYVQAVLAFDTPFLGISPGVLAHGAEEHINHASAAYKAYNGASELFGWNSAASQPQQPIANASSRGLPAPGASSSGWGKWGKYAMFGGAAAAVAGAAGAAYMNWNQINQGLAWAGSHLEFVGCLARGAELQKRVESVINLTETHGVGFADFYTVLGEKVSSKTQYAGAMLGQDRTFCVVPKDAHSAGGSPTGSKRPPPKSGEAQSPPKRRKKTSPEEAMEQEVKDGEKVQEFARDTSKKKGDWVRCRNDLAPDELKAHTSMFAPGRNPGYYNMLPMARDRIVGWIDESWAKDAGGEKGEDDGDDGEGSVGGAEDENEEAEMAV